MSVPKDQSWAWKSVVGGFLSFGISLSIDLSYSIVFKDIKEYYQVNATVASLLFGLISGCRFLLSPLAVFLIKVFGCDKVAIFGSTMISLGLFVTSCAPNIIIFMISYGIFVGAGVSFSYTATIIILSENFDKRKALAFGIATSGASFAYIIFPHVFAFLINKYEFRSSLMLFSAFSLNMIVCGLLNKRPSELEKYEVKLPNQTNYKEINNNYLKKKKVKKDINLRPIKNQRFFFYVIGMTWLFLGSVPWTIFIVDFIHSIEQVNLNMAVLTFTVEGFSQIFARVLTGYIFDLSIVRKYRGVSSANCCFISALSSILLVIVNPSITSYLIISVLRGLSLGIFFSQNVVILGDICDSVYMSTSIGIMTFMKGIGCILGSILSGVIRDNFKSYFETFLFLSANQFVAGLLILYANVRNVCRKT